MFLPVSPSSFTKLLIAEGGKPRRRRAVRVNSLGSSKSLGGVYLKKGIQYVPNSPMNIV